MPWSDGLEQGTPAYQIAASTSQHIRVVAGPGTGKSFAMKRRVARLLESDIEPGNILPVTFTRVAAEDLHRELVGMDVPGCEELQGTTLHSLALKMLVRNHVLATTGRTPRPLNKFETMTMEADLATNYGGVRNVRKKVKAFESAWARLQSDEPGYVQSAEDRAFKNDLIAWLMFHRAMLIGEVIPQLHHYLVANPAAQERGEFSHILVDEYQDLNKAEQGVIELLSDNAEVCIVGDDDQSIYSFKHAHPEGIIDWLDGRNDADDQALIDCRRCPTQVVGMANALIANNVNRPVPRVLVPMGANGAGVVMIVQYQTLDDEVLGVLNKISEMVANGVNRGDILVLAQRRIIGTPIYEGLVEREIPARSYYGEAELGNKEAQRRFAILKLFVDPEDRVALRWLLGMESSTWLSGGYRRLRNYCDEHGTSTWNTLEQLEAGNINIAYTQVVVERFTEIKNEIAQLEDVGEPANITAVINHLFPEDNVHVRDIRALALKTLETIVGDDRAQFLRELTSAIVKPDIPSEIEEVRVMSIHKSKGLSAPVTIIAGCVEGLLPKQPDVQLSQAEQATELEEQRRLFYVGISRVKASPADGKPGTLILTYSQQMSFAAACGARITPARTIHGRAVLVASRFILEMGQAAPAPVAE